MKSDQMPKLTIAIPTRNRPGPLMELLESIASESNQDIEVAVSDNSDDEASGKIVEQFKDRLAIVYRKQESVVTFGGNLRTSAQMANGSYIWFMGDDDLLVPGAISAVLKKTAEADGGYVFGNFSAWNDDFSRELVPSLFIKAVDETTEAGFSGLKFIDLSALTFMGAHIVPNSDAYQRILSMHIESDYPHVMAFATLFPKSISSIGLPLIKQRYQKERRWNAFRLYTVGYPELFQELRKRGLRLFYLWKIKRRLVLKEITRGVAGECYRGSKPTATEFFSLLRFYGDTPELWLFVLPILISPQYLLAKAKKCFGYFQSE